MKLTINDVKTGKSYSKEINESEVANLENKKIKDKISVDSLSGYELEITGGTDVAGFPMRPDVDGIARRKVLLTQGPGVILKRKGMKKRKSVAGNTIKKNTSQVNAKILVYGKKELSSYFSSEENKEESKPESKKQPKKEESKPESKEQPKKEESKPEKKE